MNVDNLTTRSQLLQNELQKAKLQVTALNEQLEQAKSNVSIISGHVNEVAYQLNEAQKAKPESQEPSKEQENVQVNNEDAQQAP